MRQKLWRSRKHTHAHIHTQIHTHTHTQMQIIRKAHTHAHKHTHTHTHTHKTQSVLQRRESVDVPSVLFSSLYALFECHLQSAGAAKFWKCKESEYVCVCVCVCVCVSVCVSECEARKGRAKIVEKARQTDCVVASAATSRFYWPQHKAQRL